MDIYYQKSEKNLLHMQTSAEGNTRAAITPVTRNGGEDYNSTLSSSKVESTMYSPRSHHRRHRSDEQISSPQNRQVVTTKPLHGPIAYQRWTNDQESEQSTCAVQRQVADTYFSTSATPVSPNGGNESGKRAYKKDQSMVINLEKVPMNKPHSQSLNSSKKHGSKHSSTERATQDSVNKLTTQQVSKCGCNSSFGVMSTGSASRNVH